MPPERSRKYKERIAAAKLIEITGFEMVPCEYCEKMERKCVVAKGSSRCSECMRRGQSCVSEGIPIGDWSSLEREEERIAAAIAANQQVLIAAAAKAARLETQRNFLRRRAGEMLRKGLRSVDELEEAEKKEKDALETEKQRKLREQRSLLVNSSNPSLEPLDPDLSAALSDFDPDDPFWVAHGFSGVATDSSSGGWGDPGFVGGTPLSGPG